VVWSASEAIETGLSALDSARAGLTGEPAVVEADAGFLDTFADPPLQAYLGGFGERWHSRAVTVKGVPARGAVAAPIEAALAVRGRFDPGRTSVKRVDVRASRATVKAAERVEPYLDGPESPVAALTSSVAFNVAAALVDGEHTPRQLGERSRNAGIWRLADRVFRHQGPEFTAATLRSEATAGTTPSGGGLAAVGEAAMQLGPWGSLRHVTTLPRVARGGGIPSDLSSTSRRPGARVEVTTTDGRTVAETIEHPSGFAGKPLAEIRAVARNKCRTGLQAAGMREAAARERADELLGIDDEDVVSLAPLLEGASRR
jgi:2-methylcitrate dehydratase PrpD